MRVTLVPVIFFGLAAIAQAGEADAALGRGLEELRHARFEPAAQAFSQAVKLNPTLAIAHYDLGICYFAQGRFDDAEAAFNENLRLSPRNRFALYYLARISLIQNKLPQAISRFEALVSGGPVADEFYYLGSAYWHESNLRAAIQNLKRAAELKPSDSRVHYLLARVYKRAGNTIEAEREFRRSTELRADSQNHAQQIKLCNSALQSLPEIAGIDECRSLLDGSDPGKLVSLGALLAQKGALEAALDPLLRAARLDPDDYESYFNAGLVYIHLKRYQEAKQMLSVAVSLQPGSFEAVALLGSALFALGDDFGAVEQLRRAHQLQPDNERVTGLLMSELQIIAQHTLAQCDYRKAIGYVEDASELVQPSSQMQELAFHLATEAFAHSDYESAIRALKQSKDSLQTSAEFHAMLGYSSYKQGDAAKAVVEMQRAMDLDPKNQDYVLQLSEIFVANDNPQASNALLEAAAHAFPHSAKVWFALGVSYIAAERLDDGEAALNRSLEFDSKLDLVYVVLGQAYRNAGRWNALSLTAERLIQINPANYLGYFYKAIALSRQTDSDTSEVQNLLERSSALDTDDPEPHYELAKLLARKGEKDAAVQELEKITASNTHFAQAYYQLYRLYAERGETAKSVEAQRLYEQLRQQRGQAIRKMLVQIRER
jgi:tetratricopeptide (TPR) repeat protein